MKRPLLERPHLRPIRITPRALRENKHALLPPLHLLRGAIKHLPRALGIRPIDKHGPAQTHKPAQKGRPRQTALCRHAAVFREYGAQQQHIQLRLMIPNQHTRPRLQILLPLDDLKAYARGKRHSVFEGAGGGPLGDAVVTEGAEEEGGEDAVGGAEDEGAVGGEEAGVEGGFGDGESGEEEEGEGGAEVEG